MLDHDAHAWLGRIEGLRRPCDVDVLLFCANHRRTLTTVEQLAPLLGYPVADVTLALEGLMRAGYVTETTHPKGPPRLFVYTPGEATNQLEEFVAFASTRRGRLALRLALLTRVMSTDARDRSTGPSSEAEGTKGET